ncbi:hypothetical protein Scep_025595 [Stephania cephalantha]|uniref:Uncharacterized protein n=1 Tax=Stephania cephalantha TaxID=152367 RepID=A0AAP0HRQ4_9MAGN
MIVKFRADKSNEGVDSVIEEVVKDMIKLGYRHYSSIESREAVTPPVERVEKVNVESAQNETKLFPTFTMRASSSQQPSDLLRLFLDELKTTVENRLDRIENFLISLDGEYNKSMVEFLKLVEILVETSRQMTKEFIDRLDPVVEEYDRALKDLSVHKKWKSKYQPNKGNHD